ncbi:MAG TPA: isoprenylcysteine carboxylmethyltransferase family protein [Candidatus Binatia bacterium]|nr:isoprenylcysteine carboxylmethyltransferase family protein [Candidatus Binatia bacterium]
MRHLTFIIAIGWIIFWIYWIVSARQSKIGTPTNIGQFFAVRLAIWPLAILLALVFNHLPDSLKNHYQNEIHNHAVMATGFLIFLLGFIIAIWARRHLGKNWGMPMTKKQAPELVTSGPYSYIRHPIYTGILLMVLGSFLIVNMYWLIVFIIASVYFIYSAFAEEKLMMQQFPKVYPSYKAKTKMLIPLVF